MTTFKKGGMQDISSWVLLAIALTIVVVIITSFYIAPSKSRIDEHCCEAFCSEISDGDFGCESFKNEMRLNSMDKDIITCYSETTNYKQYFVYEIINVTGRCESYGNPD